MEAGGWIKVSRPMMMPYCCYVCLLYLEVDERRMAAGVDTALFNIIAVVTVCEVEPGKECLRGCLETRQHQSQ